MSKFLEICNRSSNNHSHNARKPPNFNIANHAWKHFLLLYHLKANIVITVKYSEPRKKWFLWYLKWFSGNLGSFSELYDPQTFRVRSYDHFGEQNGMHASSWASRRLFLSNTTRLNLTWLEILPINDQDTKLLFLSSSSLVRRNHSNQRKGVDYFNDDGSQFLY